MLLYSFQRKLNEKIHKDEKLKFLKRKTRENKSSQKDNLNKTAIAVMIG